jgi:hypothetical protein
MNDLMSMEYAEAYGHAPLKRQKDFGGGLRPVNSYIELDRPLVDRAFAAWVSEATA